MKIEIRKQLESMNATDKGKIFQVVKLYGSGKIFIVFLVFF